MPDPALVPAAAHSWGQDCSAPPDKNKLKSRLDIANWDYSKVSQSDRDNMAADNSYYKA